MSPWVSMSLLGILADLKNSVVWVVSIRPPISSSSSSLSKPLETVPSVPTTIGITVTLMFYSFLSYLARYKYSFFLSFSLIFTLWSAFFSLFLLITIWPGLLSRICYYYYYYYYYYLLIRVFHISVSLWSFTGDWVTTSLLKSPGLFSVFWPFSII